MQLIELNLNWKRCLAYERDWFYGILYLEVNLSQQDIQVIINLFNNKYNEWKSAQISTEIIKETSPVA